MKHAPKDCLSLSTLLKFGVSNINNAHNQLNTYENTNERFFNVKIFRLLPNV